MSEDTKNKAGMNNMEHHAQIRPTHTNDVKVSAYTGNVNLMPDDNDTKIIAGPINVDGLAQVEVAYRGVKQHNGLKDGIGNGNIKVPQPIGDVKTKTRNITKR